MSRVSSTIASVCVVLMALTMGVIEPKSILQAQPLILNQSQHPDNQEEVQVFSGTIVAMTPGIFFLKDDAKFLSGFERWTMA